MAKSLRSPYDRNVAKNTLISPQLRSHFKQFSHCVTIHVCEKFPLGSHVDYNFNPTQMPWDAVKSVRRSNPDESPSLCHTVGVLVIVGITIERRGSGQCQPLDETTDSLLKYNGQRLSATPSRREKSRKVCSKKSFFFVSLLGWLKLLLQAFT